MGPGENTKASESGTIHDMAVQNGESPREDLDKADGVVKPTRGSAGDEIEVEFRTVEYDSDREARDIEHSGLPRILADAIRASSAND